MRIKKYSSFDITSIIIYVLSLSILPFLILSLFSHPSLDDFDFSEKVNEMGFLDSQLNWYYKWTGRFFSTAFLSTLNPLIYKSFFGFKILILALIIVFIYGIYFLISGISGCKISNKEKLLIALSFSFLYIYGMPTSRYGFYWFSSAVIYQGANILMAFLFGLFFKLLKSDNRNGDNMSIALGCFLILAVCGSNELSMAMLTTLLFLSLILDKIINKSFNRIMILFFFTSVIAFVVVFLSPGNDHRFGYKDGSRQLLFSITNTVSGVFEYVTYRNINLPFALFTIIFIGFLLKYDSDDIYQNKFFSVNPLWPASIFILTLSSGFFASYWSTGNPPFQRRLNSVYFVFLLGWFINIFIVVNYVKRKYNFKFKLLPDKYIYRFICAVLAVSIIVMSNRIKSAYGDLLRGNAFKFDQKLRERYKLIEHDQSDTCIVSTIENIPGSMFFNDVGDDLNYKYNKQIAKFFNKKYFIVKGTAFNIPEE